MAALAAEQPRGPVCPCPVKATCGGPIVNSRSRCRRCRQGTEAYRRTMCAALGVVALMAGTAQVYADAVTLRYAHLGPNRGVQGSNIEWLKNEIESRTNG